MGIFVGNLDRRVDKDDLTNLFKGYAPIKSIEIKKLCICIFYRSLL